MKKLIILFLLTFLQPLHGNLPEQLGELHSSLVELKGKLGDLQKGLDTVSARLSGKKAEKEEEKEEVEVEESEDIDTLKTIFDNANAFGPMCGRHVVSWYQTNKEAIKTLPQKEPTPGVFNTFLKFVDEHFESILHVGSIEPYKENWNDIEEIIDIILNFLTQGIEKGFPIPKELKEKIEILSQKPDLRQELKDLLVQLNAMIESNFFRLTMILIQNARSGSERQLQHLSAFYETLLEAFSHRYPEAFITANRYFQTSIINNIEKNLTIIHKDVQRGLALDVFFLIILSCIKNDFHEDPSIQTSENIERILKALEQDAVTDGGVDQAHFKVNWYRDLYKILSKITGPAPHAPQFIELVQKKFINFVKDREVSLGMIIKDSNDNYMFIDTETLKWYGLTTKEKTESSIKKSIDLISSGKITKICTDLRAAEIAFYTTISITCGDQHDRDVHFWSENGHGEDLKVSWINKESFEKFYNNFLTAQAKTANEAFFLREWFQMLGLFFDSVKPDFPEIAPYKTGDSISAKEIDLLGEIFTSFDPQQPGVEPKKTPANYVKDWCKDNEVKITEILDKSISEDLFNTVTTLLKDKDISYFKWGGEKPGENITNSISNFLLRALEEDSRYSDTLQTIIIDKIREIISKINSVAQKPTHQEKAQFKYQLFYLCSVLLKSNYIKEWLIDLSVHLLLKESTSYDINNLFETLLQSALISPDGNIRAKIFEYLSKENTPKELTLEISKKLNLHLPQDFFSNTKPGRDYFNRFYIETTRAFFLDVSFRKAHEFDMFLRAEETPEKLFEAEVLPIETVETPELKPEALSASTKQEEIKKKISAWITKTIKEFTAKKSIDAIRRLLIDCQRIKSLKSAYLAADKEALMLYSGIIKEILNKKDLLVNMIQDALSLHSQNFLRLLLDFVIWVIKEGKDDQLKADNLSVKDSAPYQLTLKNGKKENLIKHLILGIAGNVEQQKTAQAIFDDVSDGATAIRKRLKAFYEEMKAAKK